MPFHAFSIASDGLVHVFAIIWQSWIIKEKAEDLAKYNVPTRSGTHQQYLGE